MPLTPRIIFRSRRRREQIGIERNQSKFFLFLINRIISTLKKKMKKHNSKNLYLDHKRIIKQFYLPLVKVCRASVGNQCLHKSASLLYSLAWWWYPLVGSDASSLPRTGNTNCVTNVFLSKSVTLCNVWSCCWVKWPPPKWVSPSLEQSH